MALKSVKKMNQMGKKHVERTYQVKTVSTEKGIVGYSLGLPRSADVSLVAAIMIDQMNAQTMADPNRKNQYRSVMILSFLRYLIVLRYNSRIAQVKSLWDRFKYFMYALINTKRSEKAKERIKNLMSRK